MKLHNWAVIEGNEKDHSEKVIENGLTQYKATRKAVELNTYNTSTHLFYFAKQQ